MSIHSQMGRIPKHRPIPLRKGQPLPDTARSFPAFVHPAPGVGKERGKITGGRRPQDSPRTIDGEEGQPTTRVVKIGIAQRCQIVAPPIQVH